MTSNSPSVRADPLSPTPFLKPNAAAFIVGIPLLVGLSMLSVYADMVTSRIQMGVMQLAPTAVAALLALALINRALSHFHKREWLTKADLLTIYAMLLVGVLVSTRGVVEKLIPPLAYLPYFSTRENGWNEQLTQHLPGWAVPFVPSAQAGAPPAIIAGYWEGNASVPWTAWVGPLCAWFALVGCVLWCFLCLAALLRRQWMDNEQIRFPLTTLPLAIIRDEVEGQSFLSNRSMWLGFGLAFGVFFLNGLNANFSDFPSIATTFNFSGLITERPWSQIGAVTAFLSLAAFGFAYFLPADLLFSLWFFYALTRVTDIGVAMTGGVPTGMGTHGTNMLQGYQAVGAYLVLIGAQIRQAWPFFKDAWQTAFGRHKPLDDSDELLSYRATFLGLFFSVGGIVLWLSLAGMNPILALAQMGIYIFLIALLMSRATCEAGLLGTETSFLPGHLINLVYPLPPLGAQNLTMLGLTDIVFTRDLRGTLLSTFLDSQKSARELKMSLRALLVPIVTAILVSLVAATAFFLWLHYDRGGLSLYAYPKFNAANLFGRAGATINGSAPPRDATAYGGVISGGLITAALVALRARFSWFPLHPLGFALAPAGTMNVYWFPFFAAWVVKTQVLRFGGIDTYRRLAPFMLGLILGEFMSGIFWTLGQVARGWNVPNLPWP